MATVTRELLRELVALVRGECPSLLNEDSGGDVRLSMAIDDALASPPAEDELQRHDCETWAMEGIGCAHCNPVALAIRAAQAPPASDPPGLVALVRELVEWYDARFVQNLGEPFANLIARCRAALPASPQAETKGDE